MNLLFTEPSAAPERGRVAGEIDPLARCALFSAGIHGARRMRNSRLDVRQIARNPVNCQGY